MDDGAVFYINGVEVYRTNITGTPKSTTPADTDVVYPKFSSSIEIPASAVVPGTNVLAVELHQHPSGTTDAFLMAQLDMIETPAPPNYTVRLQLNEIASATAPSWFVELRNTSSSAVNLTGWTLSSSTGTTYSLTGSVAAGALLSLDQATLGWRPPDGAKIFLSAPGSSVEGAVVKLAAQARDASGRWRTPSAPTAGTSNTFSIPDSIVINEIMYNHAPVFLPTGSTPNAEEWIELYNKSSSPVVLTGWKVRGGVSFDFTAGTTIPAGGYLVVANDAPALLAKFPGITVVGPLGGSLSNSDDLITLEDGTDNVVNEVHYFEGGRWDERADGGGGSLELRNPGMDNTVPEAWAASDETSKSSWQTFTYTGLGAPPPGSNDPIQYNELVMGLLDKGECLIDDVSVLDVTSGSIQLIQNSNFSAGTATAWRNIGNHGSHGRTVVVDDPSSPGNKVLKVVATSATEHMHNHLETTLKNGASYVALNSANTYAVSFRARWLSGSPRLNSRLYFNRLARTSLLPMPQNNGTPGAQNSRFVALAGPTCTALSHSPVLPQASAAVTVSVKAADPQCVAGVSLKWRLDGSVAFNTVAMTFNGDHYEGTIPGQVAGSLGQFYVEATDGTTVSTYPAAGANSRAMIRWADGSVPTTAAHGVRILMLTADANFMHDPTNCMSNDFLPCTIVYRESEVFYDASVRLKSSERGRPADIRLGFAINFDPMQPFRGAHTSINLDRSGYGRGTAGSGFGHSEIIIWHFMQRAGGVPSMWNDIGFVIAPRSGHNGSAILTMAEFNDVWADSTFENGASQPSFKYELIYYPTTTVGGGPEDAKLPIDDNVVGVEFETYTTADKEAFRWNFLLGSARTNDDYSGMLELNQTYRIPVGDPAFNTALPNTIDVDQWLRTAAALALGGIQDNYITTSDAWHNLKLYSRIDGRMLFLPWDLDFQTAPSDDPLILNLDIARITSAIPANQRLYYQHLQDIIATSFNSAYLSSWITHYPTFSTAGGNWGEITTYVDARVAFVNAQIAANYPPTTFDVTTADFSTSGSSATIGGNGWINVRTIAILNGSTSLPVVWTSGSAWQATVPVSPGVNALTIQAFDYQGNLVGTDTITITGTGATAAAAAGNIVISEIYYNPENPSGPELAVSTDKDEFEFIELRNISATDTVSLAGCIITGGIDYTFPATTIPPGGYAVIPRNRAAFAVRFPSVTALPHYYIAGTNFLRNSGDTITIYGANGLVVTSSKYDDATPAWPTQADGHRGSLVLIAPLTNPDANDPLNWRDSATSYGTPGTSDAIATPITPTPAELLAHSIGTGAMPIAGSELVLGQRTMNFTFERNPLADVNWTIESATALTGPWTAVGTTYKITARNTLVGGNERLTLRATTPMTGISGFLRAKLRVP